MNTGNVVKRAFAMACATALCSFALAGTAFAATVHGADFHGGGTSLESGQIDVLDVDGAAGETVFLSVSSGRATLAKNLPYTVGKDAEAGDASEWAGVATLDIADLNLDALDGSYVVEAYADRAGSSLLYTGAIYGVYADLPGGASKLIGTRTVNADEAQAREFDPPETVYDQGRTYRLVNRVEGSSPALHFAYDEYDEATTVDGVLKYYDATGATVATTTIPGLAYGEQRTVNVPSVVVADNGDVYRTVFFKNSVVAENPGRTSFSIYCSQMSAATQALAGYYVATIQMVDAQGKVIATDSVDVTGEFLYTAPATIYKTETVNGQSAVVTYKIDGSQTIRLSAANDGVHNRARTVQVGYTAQPLDANEVSVAFNMVDGSKSIGDKDRKLGTAYGTASEQNPTVVPPEQYEANGTTYYLVGDPQDYAYTHRSGEVPIVDVYYTPEGYTAPGARDVTVNYVNFITGATVESHAYTTDPDSNARVVIDTPETFSAEGVNYVRLAGQEASIRHSYYSGIESYTVYYRDENDTLSNENVISKIRVVMVDGEPAPAGEPGTTTTTTTNEVVVIPAEATAAAGDAAAAGAEGAQALQLNDGRTYNALEGEGGNATLTNESGVDSNTERIEDSETPLASGFDRGGTSSAASSFMQMSGWMIPAAIAVVVIIAAVAVLMAIRRRKNNDTYEA